jgi:antitoxin YefM
LSFGDAPALAAADSDNGSGRAVAVSGNGRSPDRADARGLRADGIERHEKRGAAGEKVVSDAFLTCTNVCTYKSTSLELIMDVVTYSDARANLKDVMDRVVDDKTEVIVTRQKAEAIVMISLSEWNSISETLHLLSSAKNAERLRKSMREMDAGKGVKRELVEADETPPA